MVLWSGLAASMALIGQAPLVFPASTERVHLVVSVTGESGQPIRGLRREDFTVAEDGAESEITSFAPCADSADEFVADCHVDMALLVDTSESMQDIIRRTRATAAEFIKSVPGALGRILIAFDADVRILSFNENNPVATLDSALANHAGDRTRLFDAVLEGVKRLATGAGRRTIIVALTDGEDTGADGWRDPRGFANPLDASQSRPASEVARELQRESITFHAISFADHLSRESPRGMGARRAAHGRATLKSLATESGGLVVEGTATDLASQFALIRNDIAAQYVLGLAPRPSPAGSLHSLRVKVSAPGATVRHRLAYQTKPPS